MTVSSSSVRETFMPQDNGIPTNSKLCYIENGQGDGIRTRTVRVTGGDANYYITTLIKWSPWSDSHRRIRVYETRPVAAEAQGPLSAKCRMKNAERKLQLKIGALTWICTTNLRL